VFLIEKTAGFSAVRALTTSVPHPLPFAYRHKLGILPQFNLSAGPAEGGGCAYRGRAAHFAISAAGIHRGHTASQAGLDICERAFVIRAHPGIVRGSNAGRWRASQNLGYRTTAIVDDRHARHGRL